MPDALTAKQLREKVDAKRSQLREVFEQTKTDNADAPYDFQKAKADWLGDDVLKLKGTEKTLRICELVHERSEELDDLQRQLDVVERAESDAKAFQRAEEGQGATPAGQVHHPGAGGTKQAPRFKSIGARVVEHEHFKAWQDGDFSRPIELADAGLLEINKTLFQTSAGWTPETTRTGYVVDDVTRPLQVMDIMPMGETGQSAVPYMEETTRTHAAAETSEGSAYNESTFALTEQSSTVRKITDSVPVTDEQLEDVPMAQSYLEGRLLYGVRQRLDGQIIAGDGIAPNIDGIVNVSGIQTQAKGADPVPDAIYKAMTKVRVTGRAVPTHVLLHPNDWQDIRLQRTTDGIYIWGNPSEAGPMRIWGLPVIENESLTENTGLVGSFLSAWIQLVERRGIIIEMGYVDDDFTKGKKTLRGSGRWALPVYRPAAFCTVTSI